jgi:hypothetical protein
VDHIRAAVLGVTREHGTQAGLDELAAWDRAITTCGIVLDPQQAGEMATLRAEVGRGKDLSERRKR